MQSLLLEYLPTVTVDEAYLSLVEKGRELATPYPRYWDKLKFCLRNGYRNLNVDTLPPPAQGWWDENKKSHRGWPLRSFSQRTDIVHTALKELNETEQCTLEEFKKALSTQWKYHTFLYLKETAVVGIENEGLSLGLHNSTLGASISIDIPNRHFLYAKHTGEHLDSTVESKLEQELPVTGDH